MYILNNKQLLNHIGLKQTFDEIHKSFSNKLTCNIDHEISIHKGYCYLSLCQNKHNCKYYIQLNGETTFYLFNPKHKGDIQNKKKEFEIKKWAFKINLKWVQLSIYHPNGIIFTDLIKIQ